MSLSAKAVSPGNYKYLISKTDTTNGYALYTGSNGNLRMYIGTGSAQISDDVGNIIWDGKWHHVSSVYDGNYLDIYVDAVRRVHTATTGDITSSSVKSLVVGWNSSSLYFTGSIDDVRIYNRALSAGEVNKLWQMGR